MNLRGSVLRLSDHFDERLHPVFYHLFQAFVFLCVIFFAFLSSANTTRISFLGVTVPQLCIFHGVTSLDCPGCGLTRSLVFALHGQFYQSYLMHLWGIPLVAFVAIQIPYRIWRASGGRPIHISKSLTRWFQTFVLISVLLPWTVKTVWVIYDFYLR